MTMRKLRSIAWLRTVQRLAGVAITAFLLASCGFHLRGSAQIPFRTLALSMSDASGLGIELRRNLRSAANVQLVSDPKQADAIFELISETRDKEVLSINSAGRAREYTLKYRISYRVHDAKGRDFIETSTLALKRDISFNEDALLAKESEEGLLYRDMQTDMVQQILRRLSLVKVE
jgi:LPS-assembly lipoprotein